MSATIASATTPAVPQLPITVSTINVSTGKKGDQ